MADTYKGETLGKKCARAYFWLMVRRYFGADFLAGKHLVLASRFGGDATVLKALGVRPQNIVAVEREKSAALAFQAKHPDVPTFVAELDEVVRLPSLRKSLLSAHLDFCGTWSDDLLDLAMATARFALRDRGLLTLGVMMGREDTERFAPIMSEKTRLRRSRRDQRAALARGAVLDRGLLDRCRTGPPVLCCAMGATTYNSGHTPMLYRSYTVHRDASRQSLSKAVLQELEKAEAREDARGGVSRRVEIESERIERVMLQMDADKDPAYPLNNWGMHNERFGRLIQQWPLILGLASPATVCAVADVARLAGAPEAAVLTILPGRLAAWRAHATRGTYAKAS